MLWFVLSAALVAVDQLVKYLIRTGIPLGESAPFVPGLLDLTHVHNTGAAFSIFQGQTWLLALVSLAASVLLAAALWRKIFPHPVGCLALAVTLGGAVGNWIDRAFLGYVTDMFMTTFIPFPVFNVADICVVLGGIAIAADILFLEQKGEDGGGDAAAEP